MEDTERNEDKDQRNMRAKYADSLASPEDGCSITTEHGTLISNLKDDVNAKEGQTNHQGGGPENPLLVACDQSVGDLGPQFDIGLPDPDQLWKWEPSSKCSDELFNNFMQDPHDFEKSL